MKEGNKVHLYSVIGVEATKLNRCNCGVKEEVVG
jgi:hypothetical protein